MPTRHMKCRLPAFSSAYFILAICSFSRYCLRAPHWQGFLFTSLIYKTEVWSWASGQGSNKGWDGGPRWAKVATSVSAAVCPAEAQWGDTHSLLWYTDVWGRYGDKLGLPLVVNREVAVPSCVSVTRIFLAWAGQWSWLETQPAWGGGGKIQG